MPYNLYYEFVWTAHEDTVVQIAKLRLVGDDSAHEQAGPSKKARTGIQATCMATELLTPVCSIT